MPLNLNLALSILESITFQHLNQVPTNFLRATNAYAPRQVQFALRLGF